MTDTKHETRQNATHTPGPWKLHHIKEHFSGINDLYRICWSDDGECVAEIIHGEANARLIAAAPRMLAALQAILGDAAHISHHTPHLGDDYWQEARAVIAEATNQSSREAA